jgi:thioredoxin 1
MTPKISIKYFTSSGCNVCKILLPKIEKLIRENFSFVDLTIVDIKKTPIIAADNQVFTIPSLIIFLNNQEQFRFVRVFSLVQIQEKLERLKEIYHKN